MTGPLGVVIPNYDGRELLSECLAALTRASGEFPLDIVVVDNGSRDGSVAMVQEEFPAVRVETNASNRGFTPAINQGVSATRSEWILLLNNDAIVTPGAVAALADAAAIAAADVAGFQPLLVAADDPGRVDSAGIGVGPRFRTRDLLMGQPRALAPREPVEIWGACAACLLVRREAFERAGGFDDDFFVELDDVDFAFRARWLGYRFLLVPAAVVRHYRSSGTPRHIHRKLGRVRRNGLLTVIKNYPRPAALGLLAYRAQRDLFLLPRYLRRGEAGAVFAAWRQAFGLWPAMSRKRAALRTRVRRRDDEILAQLRAFTRQSPEST